MIIRCDPLGAHLIIKQHKTFTTRLFISPDVNSKNFAIKILERVRLRRNRFNLIKRLCKLAAAQLFHNLFLPCFEVLKENQIVKRFTVKFHFHDFGQEFNFLQFNCTIVLHVKASNFSFVFSRELEELINRFPPPNHHQFKLKMFK